MENLEIQISPFLCRFYYFCYEDSYRFGINKGIIYVPRFVFREQAEAYEHHNHFLKLTQHLTHEILHKILFELEGALTSKALENIDKNLDETDYIISNIGDET